MAQKPAVGILGGGQLGALLGRAAQSLQLSPLIYLQSPQETAAKWQLPYLVGQYTDTKSLQSFFNHVDCIVFENEFFPRSLVESAQGYEHKFFPGLNVLTQLQNKAQQKLLFLQANIPSPKFELFTGTDCDLEEWLKSAQKNHGTFILKWAFGGYDGKGVLKYESIESALKFCREGLTRGTEIYLEEFVPFALELAMIGAKNKRGDFVHFPLVISKQEAAICKWVTGPAVKLGMLESLEMQASAILKKFAHHTQLVGSFAMEFFLGPGGQLLVNEVAPRVHNSGHYSLNACSLSQFQMHWLASMNETLPHPACENFFGMLNLIGNTHQTPAQPPRNLSPLDTLCWYEKNDLRPKRKMGHINTLANTADELELKLHELRKLDHQWMNNNLKEPQ